MYTFRRFILYVCIVIIIISLALSIWFLSTNNNYTSPDSTKDFINLGQVANITSLIKWTNIQEPLKVNYANNIDSFILHTSLSETHCYGYIKYYFTVFNRGNYSSIIEKIGPIKDNNTCQKPIKNRYFDNALTGVRATTSSKPMDLSMDFMEDCCNQSIFNGSYHIGQLVTCWQPASDNYKQYNCGNDACYKIFDPKNDITDISSKILLIKICGILLLISSCLCTVALIFLCVKTIIGSIIIEDQNSYSTIP